MRFIARPRLSTYWVLKGSPPRPNRWRHRDMIFESHWRHSRTSTLSSNRKLYQSDHWPIIVNNTKKHDIIDCIVWSGRHPKGFQEVTCAPYSAFKVTVVNKFISSKKHRLCCWRPKCHLPPSDNGALLKLSNLVLAAAPGAGDKNKLEWCLSLPSEGDGEHNDDQKRQQV